MRAVVLKVDQLKGERHGRDVLVDLNRSRRVGAAEHMARLVATECILGGVAHVILLGPSETRE